MAAILEFLAKMFFGEILKGFAKRFNHYLEDKREEKRILKKVKSDLKEIRVSNKDPKKRSEKRNKLFNS